MIQKVDLCGTVSGQNTDKFAVTGLTPLATRVVKPPLIQECPMNIECKLVNVIPTGDHDLFIGRVAR